MWLFLDHEIENEIGAGLKRYVTGAFNVGYELTFLSCNFLVCKYNPVIIL